MQNRKTLKEAYLEKMRSKMLLGDYSWKTEQSYLRSVSWFWDEAEKMPKEWSREKKAEEWLSRMVEERDISGSTQNVRFSAILYFFRHVVGQPLKEVNALRAKRKPTFRVSVSREQTIALLDAVPDLGGQPTNFIARLIYACGLRVTEPLNLRIKDIDFSKSALMLWETKGDQCRIVPVPCHLMTELRAQMDIAKGMWKLDVQRKLPIALPGALAKKYAGRVWAWNWYWLFPQRQPCRHPRTKELVRYRMHEANVQRAVRVAASKVGLEGVITPHNLRHCYGTHVAESGQNMRALQQALGHKSLETTMGYVHADALSVRSPLEAPSAPENVVEISRAKRPYFLIKSV